MPEKYPGCDCEVCPFKDRQFVPPSGPPDSEVLFLGQAPAWREVQTGIPFTGPSGAAFNAALEENGLSREEVRVDNCILCFFKGGERLPPEAITACSGHLDLAGPKVVVPMGNDALGVTVGVWDGIMKLAGVAFWSKNDNYVVPLVHPAFYIRSAPNDFREFLNSMGVIADLVRGRSYFHLGSECRVMTNKQETLKLLRDLGDNPPESLSVDLETSQPDIASATILCVALAWEESVGVVIPWDSRYLEKHGSSYQGLLDDEEVYEALKGCLEAQKVILAHNAPFDIGLLRRESIDAFARDDTLLMHYTLDERTRAQGLKAIARSLMGLADWEMDLKKYLPTKESPFDLVPPEVLFPYAAKDACIELALRGKLREMLDSPENEGPGRLYDGDEAYPGLMAISRMFIDIQTTGVRMDRDLITTALKEMPSRLQELEQELQELVGSTFYSPGSYNDNKYYLFEKFKLPHIKGDSTDHDVLEALKGHPFVDLLIEYRSYLKVCNTYIINIARAYRNGRGYPDTKLFGSATGRLTANKLNPLVFPRESRGGLYTIVKRIFIADEDCFLLQSDYKGMELRVLAILSQAPWLLEQLSDPDVDIHASMAEQMYGITFLEADEKKRKELRVIAKMLVFGLGFRRGAASIGRQLGCSRSEKKVKALGGSEEGVFCDYCDAGLPCRLALKEALELVDAFFRPIPEVREYQERQNSLAKSRGYLENPLGRRRRWPLITDGNIGEISTQSANTDVQSTANDCNLTSMHRLHTEMSGLVKPLWPVHDSILQNVSLKATADDVRDIIQILEETPQRLLNTDLPFFVDVDTGFRWGELSTYEGRIPVRA